MDDAGSGTVLQIPKFSNRLAIWEASLWLQCVRGFWERHGFSVYVWSRLGAAVLRSVFVEKCTDSMGF